MENLKIVLLLSVLFGVTSCIDAAPRDSTPKISVRQRVINSYVGSPVTNIITKWRAPDKSLHIAGKEYIVYETTYYRNTWGVTGSSSYEYVGCTWTWEIKNGIIVSGSASGHRCDDG